MNDKSNIKRWANAHVFYDKYTEDINVRTDELGWRKALVADTPNGHLLKKNSFFDMLHNDKIYLAHITSNLDAIKAQGRIYSSGGCLVGSVYCTPVTKSDNDNSFKLHNLGNYIFHEEAPRSLGTIKTNDLDLLLLEISLKDKVHDPIGIDYLRLGQLHFDIYSDLEFLLSINERSKLRRIVEKKIHSSLDLLNRVIGIDTLNSRVESTDIIDCATKSIGKMPVLGYMYFEVFSEYIMLHEDNDDAKNSHASGELHNASYKRLVFELFPQLLNNFSLSEFTPSFTDLAKSVNQANIISDFSEEHMLDYISRRLIYLIQSRLLARDANKIGIKHIRWKFDELSQHFAPLMGHLIHRELRSFGRYPHFYFYFDQTKALQIWNYWNSMAVQIPFNGIIPKGEVGINPAVSDSEYRIYSTKVYYREDGGTSVKIDKELDLELVPRLVDLKFTYMRSTNKI
ncbi:hypothetical protein KBC70_03715 [Candidatus Woesebacteria bacterium]|nr:hypothetical protein [Candidatus Woesebacteria bacterium]